MIPIVVIHKPRYRNITIMFWTSPLAFVMLWSCLRYVSDLSPLQRYNKFL